MSANKNNTLAVAEENQHTVLYDIVGTSRNGGKVRYNSAGLGKAAALGELYVDTQTLNREFGGIPCSLTVNVVCEDGIPLLPNDFVRLSVDTQAELEATGVKYPAVEAGASALAAFGIAQAGRPAARTAKEAPALLTVTRRGAPAPSPAPAPAPAPRRRTAPKPAVHTDTLPVTPAMAIAAQGGDSRLDALENTVGQLSGQLGQLIAALSGSPKVRK